jgi:signal transduction histidine kinase
VNQPEGSRTERRVSSPPVAAPELGDALSVAAHDVAEAIRVVSGYLELLGAHAAGTLDETAQRYVAGVSDGVGHLDALLTGLLAYIRANVEPLELEPTDLGETLEEALRALRPRLEERRARVQFEGLPEVLVDPGRTRDALGELVANALTFASEEPPVITVSAERDGGGWRVDVRDNGIGLPADARERALEPFERAHPRSVATGPGLGLAVASTVIRRRGGRLWLEAADGGGTVARLTIPDEPPAT